MGPLFNLTCELKARIAELGRVVIGKPVGIDDSVCDIELTLGHANLLSLFPIGIANLSESVNHGYLALTCEMVAFTDSIDPTGIVGHDSRG